ncbi:putative lactoylglutathione lyase [Nymphon striatum]|nr:putative lactoylglutathione lyase [Nymphon striatum]
MVRVKDLDASLHFYCTIFGLEEVRRHESEKGRFTLVFLVAPEDKEAFHDHKAPALELTYNWDPEEYSGGRNFGHLAYLVDDIYQTCQNLMENGVTINRPPRDGHMAFVRSPDGISIEILQKALPLIRQKGFVGTLPQPTAADVLALNDEDGLPKPETRPGVVATTAQPIKVATATPPPAPQVQTTANIQRPSVNIEPKPDNAEPQSANQRIAAAAAAPVAGGAVAAATSTAATTPAPQIVAASASAPKKNGFLNGLFRNKSNRAEATKKIVTAKAQAPKPKKVIAKATASGSTATLPGVSKERALGVTSSSKSTTKPVEVASAAGLARLTPNGLKKQHAGVSIKCLKPSLVRVLKKVEKRYGSPVIVTSGYRSAKRNAAIRGAKNSLHIYCSAADIQVKGVSKWTLAKYLRSLPGRGGVGTYCHTKSVHIDIGPKRDWNWRCKRG